MLRTIVIVIQTLQLVINLFKFLLGPTLILTLGLTPILQPTIKQILCLIELIHDVQSIPSFHERLLISILQILHLLLVGEVVINLHLLVEDLLLITEPNILMNLLTTIFGILIHLWFDLLTQQPEALLSWPWLNIRSLFTVLRGELMNTFSLLLVEM